MIHEWKQRTGRWMHDPLNFHASVSIFPARDQALVVDAMSTAEAELAREVESFVHPKELTQEELYALDYEEAAWPEDYESARVMCRGHLVVMHPIKYFDEDYSTHVWSTVKRWADIAPHENVAELVAFTTDPEFSSVMRPYFARGTLRENLVGIKSAPRTIERGRRRAQFTRLGVIWSLLKGAAAGLAELHRQRMIHGNLTLSNIAVGDDGQAKLVEMRGVVGGNWRWGVENINHGNRRYGHSQYQAPELRVTASCSLSLCTRESDVFSLGQCVQDVVQAANIRNDIGQSCGNLLRRMCADDPNLRPLASEVVRALPSAYELLTAIATTRLEIATKSVHDISEHENSELEDLELTRLEQIITKLKADPTRHQLMAWIVAELEQFQILIDARVVQLECEARYNHCHIVRALSRGSWLERLRSFHDAITELKLEGRGPLIYTNNKTQTDGSIENRDDWNKIRKQQMEAQSTRFINAIYAANASPGTCAEVNNMAEELWERYLDAIVTCRHEFSACNKQHPKHVATAVESFDSRMSSCKDQPPPWFVPWYDVLFRRNIEPLGQGSFGLAWLAIWDDNHVVVKTLHKLIAQNIGNDNPLNSISFSSFLSQAVSLHGTADTKSKREQCVREANIWNRLHSPRVVKLFKASHVTSPQFVCEYAELGSLDKYLQMRKESKRPVSHEELWSLLYQACLGLRCLHEQGISHGDLKCDNILIGSDGTAKLSDFGLSYEGRYSEGATEELPPSAKGAYQWKAPERLINPKGKYTEKLKSPPSEWIKSDVYSMGMCFVEAVTGQTPFAYMGNNFSKEAVALNRISLRCPLKELNEDSWEWKLISDMTCYRPGDRLSIELVLDRIANNLPKLHSCRIR